MLELDGISDLDHLAGKYAGLLRDGKEISVAEFAAQHPEVSDAITKYFPAIASMEQLRVAHIPSQIDESNKPKDGLKQLGDFRIIREVGRGGMGVVYLAEQMSLGRQIALKVLPPECLSEPKYARRFEREARIAANLHHTHIVPVFGIGREQETLFIAMQFIGGISLEQLIQRMRLGLNANGEPGDLKSSLRDSVAADSVLSEVNGTEDSIQMDSIQMDSDQSRQVAEIGHQAASAIQFAHEQGVLHRDVTPGNLLLDRQGKCWVADFGLASAVNHENLTETGAVMGTLNYMAPEQYTNSGDERSDVYSLGLTLFELATLKRARDASEFFKAVAENRSPQPLLSLRKLNPGVHRDLESIIARAIESNPVDRYQSAQEMAVDLRCFLDREPLKTKPPNSFQRVFRWARRNPLAASASGIASTLLLLIAVLSTFGYVRELQHRAQNEALTSIATEALDEIYAQLAPRNLPQDLPAIRVNRMPISSFDVVQMPSEASFAVLEKLQSHYERISELSFDPTLKLKAADAKNRIGQINIYLGRLAAAEHAFVDSAGMCEEILNAKYSRDDRVRNNATILLAATWNQLGYVFRGQFNDGLSTKAHDRAFKFLQAPSSSLATQAAYQFELARTLYSQDVSSVNEPSRSRTEKALEILNRMENTDSDSEVQLLLARCYRRLSERLGSLPNQYDVESIRIMRALTQRFPDLPQYRFELGYSLSGNHFLEVRNPEAYFLRIQEANALAKELVASQPNVPKYMQLMVLANEKHAAYFRSHNQPVKAKRYAETAIGLQKSLLKRFPQLVAQHRVFLYALRLERTHLMVDQQDFSQAQKELVKITDSVEEMIRNPKLERDWHALRVLTASYDSLARISDYLDETEFASVARAKADQYRERLFKISS